MTPMFSIIVPIYKVEDYLKDCVDSLLAQTYKNFEIILVDDGSPDNCPEICDEYATKDTRIKVVHQKNKGLVGARKAGAIIATGRYIVVVDGDDFIEPTYLEEFEIIIRQYKPDIIVCGYYEYTDGIKVERCSKLPYGFYDKQQMINQIYPILIESEYGERFSPTLWAKAFKKEIYKHQQFVPDTICVGEDHACTKPCIYHAKSIYILNKCLYYYRQNPSSITKKLNPFLWNGPKDIGLHFEKYINMKEYDFQDQIYRNTVRNVFNVAYSQFYQYKPYREVKKEIINHIQDDFYQQAIRNCKYESYWKGSLAKYALKYKQIWLIYLYCLIAKIQRTMTIIQI